MSDFHNRNEYTTSGSWPVVPFCLIAPEDDNKVRDWREKLKLNPEGDYDIWFDETLVKGWSLGVSEKTNRALLVYSKTPEYNNGKLVSKKTESNLFYQVLSPICGGYVRKYCLGMCEWCISQDDAVCELIFKELDSYDNDTESREDRDMICCLGNNPKNPDEYIEINIEVKYYPEHHIVKNNSIMMYFEYKCPKTGMTEIATPIFIENRVIALVVMGQIIENPIKVKETLLSLNPIFKSDDFDKYFDNVVKEQMAKDDTLKVFFDEINKLKKFYQNMLDGKRKTIMNNIIQELAYEDTLLTNYRKKYEEDNEKSAELKTSYNNIPAEEWEKLNAIIFNLKEKIGVVDVLLYLDAKGKPNVNIDGKFFNNIVKADIRQGESKWYDDVSFEDFDLFTGVDENTIKMEKRAEGKNASLYVSLPEDKNDPPVILGIIYVNKDEYFARQGDRSLYWEDYVLYPNPQEIKTTTCK